MHKNLTQKPKIFLTGATGFVGSKLADKLIIEGYEVYALVRDKQKSKRLKRKGLHIILGNIAKPKTYLSTLKTCDIVVHLAAIRSNWGDRKEFLRVNAETVKFLFQQDSNIKHVILTSSVYAMGMLNKLPADEDSPLRAKDIYGLSKVLAETTAKRSSAKTKIPYTIIRPAIIYGPGDNESAFMTKFINLIKARRLPKVGNGENLLHLIFIDDLVEAYIKAVKARPQNRTYILAGQDPISFNNLSDIISRELKTDYKPRKIPKGLIWPAAYAMEAFYKIGFRLAPQLFKNEPPLSRIKIQTLFGNWHYDIRKARKQLKFRPKIDYQTGIRMTLVDHYRSD